MRTNRTNVEWTCLVTSFLAMGEKTTKIRSSPKRQVVCWGTGLVLGACLGLLCAPRRTSTSDAIRTQFRPDRILKVQSSQPFNHLFILYRGCSLFGFFSITASRWTRLFLFSPLDTQNARRIREPEERRAEAEEEGAAGTAFESLSSSRIHRINRPFGCSSSFFCLVYVGKGAPRFAL